MMRNWRYTDSLLIFWLRNLIAVVIMLLNFCIYAYGDPGTITLASVLVSLAVSAASTVASMLISAAFAPKPKPIDKNKLQGDIQIATTGEGIPIIEPYGARGEDGKGGIKIGGFYNYASPIRLHIIPKTTSGGGGGGGKAGTGGKTQTTNEYHYLQDLGVMFGRGPLRFLEVKLGTDIVYRNYPKPGNLTGTSYEVEVATLAGGAVIVNATGFSNGQKVTMPTNATATWSITGDGQSHAVYIQYKSNADKTLNVTINGHAQSVVLPNSYNRIESVMVLGTLANGATTIFIQNPGSSVDLDKIVIAENFVTSVPITRFASISGVKNTNYVNPKESYDNIGLLDPVEEDWRSFDEYNYQANSDDEGQVEINLPSGSVMRIYEGNKTQLADPIIQAYYSSLGITDAPAFRNRAWIMFENLDITKWGSTPQVTAVVEHATITTVGAMFAHRAERVGLVRDEDFDFSAFDEIPLRGFAVSQRQGPKTEMALINRVFDLDVVESVEGKLIGVIPSEEVAATIPLKELDVWEDGKGGENGKQKPTEEIFVDEYQLPKVLNMSAFDPDKDFEVVSIPARRELTVSSKTENIETSLVLTQEELTKITKRELQKLWAEKDAMSFQTFYKYGWLKPSDLIKVETLDGVFNKVRIKGINGNLPGVLKFTNVSRELLETTERIFQVASEVPKDPILIDLPSHIVGTLIDVALLRSSESVPGIYAACARTDDAYKWKGAVLLWEREQGYERLAVMQNEATMGRTVSDPLSGDGLMGTYFSGTNFNTFLFRRVDPVISISFDDNPLPGGIADNFSVRWDGFVLPQYSQTYTFRVTGDDGFRLWVNGQLLCDYWQDGPAQRTGTIALTAGQKARIRLEFYEHLGGANIYLEWSSASQAWQTIPQSRLFSGKGALPEAPTNWTPDSWDDFSEVICDLYNGELESHTDDEVLDRASPLLVGNEIVYYGVATRINGYKNRWKFSHLRRRIRGTNSATHVGGERVVVLNDAVRFIPLDLSEYAKTRNYKFVGNGQDADMASRFSFSWTGPTNITNGTDINGNWVGNDRGTVLASSIDAKIDSAEVVGDNQIVILEIKIKDLFDGGVPVHNQSDSASQVSVEAFNHFGESVKVFPLVSINKKGATATAAVPRKYADAIFGQAFFKIQIRNYYGWSAPAFLQSIYVTTSQPALRSRSTNPLELASSVAASNQVKLAWQFSGAVNIFARKVPTLPFYPIAVNESANERTFNLDYDSNYEFILEDYANIGRYSNIVRQRTYRQGENAPEYPAPIGFTFVRDSANPQTKLNGSWVRNTTDNDAVEVWVDGSLAYTLGATDEYKQLTVTAGTTKSMKIRNVFGSNYSVFTEEITATSDSTPTADSPTSGYGYYDEYLGKVLLYWTNRGGSGPFTVSRSTSDFGTFSPVYGSMDGDTAFWHWDSQSYTARRWWYKITDDTLGLSSEPFEVWIPATSRGGRGDGFETPYYDV